MKNVYSVSWVNAYLKDMITNDILLKSLYVKGEASNVKYHSSGHLYFTLKEKDAIIQCAMFSGYQKKGLCFRLKDGDEVIVRCSVDLYEKGGTYKLKVTEMYQAGAGKINEAYEKLKAELEEMGMFDPCYKRKLPEYVNRIGVVAAYPGEAVHDIIENATKRNPYIEIRVYPSYVQGEQAVQSIVNGIHALEQLGVDVMIVGRGGGSIEDLWAFNEREVAQAVFDCRVPVISAVGHETDTTIIDFVADLRAPTPSAAAELAVTDIRETFSELERNRVELNRRMSKRIQMCRLQQRQLELRLKASGPAGKIREKKMLALSLEEKLQERMQRILQSRRHVLAVYIERLKGLSPLEKLNSGYSYVTDENGKNIHSMEQIKLGQHIKVRVSDGQFDATVDGGV